MPKGKEFEYIPMMLFLPLYDSARLKPGYYYPVENNREWSHPVHSTAIPKLCKIPQITGFNYYKEVDDER